MKIPRTSDAAQSEDDEEYRTIILEVPRICEVMTEDRSCDRIAAIAAIATPRMGTVPGLSVKSQ